MAALLALSCFLLLAVVSVTIFARVRLAEQEKIVRRKDYVADMRLVDRAIQENDLGQAVGLLSKWRHRSSTRQIFDFSGGEEDLRNFEWRYFWSLCQSDELFTIGQHEDRVLCVVFSPDGQRVASSAADGEVRLWDVENRKLIGEGKHEKRVLPLAFSPDGRWLASGGDDQQVRLWDAKTLQSLGPPLDHNSALITIAFTQDSARLAIIARQEFVLWDVQQRAAKQRQAISPSTWFYGAISPRFDAVALPMPAGQRVKLWNYPPSMERAAVGELSAAVAFSRDNRFLAEGEVSGELNVWNLSDLQEVSTISTHAGVIRAIAWSPDGRKLASGGRDAVLRLWEIPSGKLLAMYRGHRGLIGSIDFSPDGRCLVSGSADGTLRVWDAIRAPASRENLPG